MDNSEIEVRLRQMQIDISEIQLKNLEKEKTEKKKKSWSNPLMGSILLALLGILGSIILSIIQQRATVKLERDKLKSTLILRALDAGDTSKAAKTLLWFVKNNLINDEDSSITKAAKNPSELPVVLAFNIEPEDFPTLMTTNVTTSPCSSGPETGCWKRETYAKNGDTVAVQVYFHNSTKYLAEDVRIGLGPQITEKGSLHVISGVVASTTIPRSEGYVIVRTDATETLSFISGSIRMYKNGEKIGYRVSDENSVFQNGIAIGNVSPGWATQGTLVAMFKVIR